jgi:regulator of nucleoside diphosphate kinase
MLPGFRFFLPNFLRLEARMAYVNDIVFSTRDAEALARLLANHRRSHPFEADGSDALADLMLDARFVPDEAMPDGYVGLHSRVTYAEERGTPLRAVVLVAPEDADAGMGRVSVLTPIGLALIGRRAGALTEAELPNGRTLKLRVLDAARPRAPVEAGPESRAEPERRAA